jgi:hypothetical protein
LTQLMTNEAPFTDQGHDGYARTTTDAVGLARPGFPKSGGDRFRQLQDDQETRRARLALEDPYRDQVRWGAEQVERKPASSPPPSRQWIVVVLAGLYAEADRKGLKSFFAATCWVVRTAEERLDEADIDLVPIQLLRSIFLVVSPRQPMQMLWRHRGTARAIATTPGRLGR